MRVTIHAIAAVLLLHSVGCQPTNSPTVNRSINRHDTGPTLHDRVATNQRPSESTEGTDQEHDPSSKPGMADDMNWQIFKNRLSQYELNKEQSHENDD